jgi:hypothetical protein
VLRVSVGQKVRFGIRDGDTGRHLISLYPYCMAILRHYTPRACVSLPPGINLLATRNVHVHYTALADPRWPSRALGALSAPYCIGSGA